MTQVSMVTLITAIATKAKASVGLLALVGGDATKIANYLPQDAQVRWVRFSIPELHEMDTKNSDGWRGTVQFDFWTDYRGILDSATAVDAIRAEVALDPTILGEHGLYVRHSSVCTGIAPDGVTYHSTVVFDVMSTL
jgi:hypothetical protein